MRPLLHGASVPRGGNSASPLHNWQNGYETPLLPCAGTSACEAVRRSANQAYCLSISIGGAVSGDTCLPDGGLHFAFPLLHLAVVRGRTNAVSVVAGEKLCGSRTDRNLPPNVKFQFAGHDFAQQLRQRLHSRDCDASAEYMNEWERHWRVTPSVALFDLALTPDAGVRQRLLQADRLTGRLAGDGEGHSGDAP